MLAKAGGGSAIKSKLRIFMNWRKGMASDGSWFNLSSSIHADYCYGFGENLFGLSDVRRNFQETLQAQPLQSIRLAKPLSAIYLVPSALDGKAKDVNLQ